MDITGFKIEKELGRGGMGVIYEVTAKDNHKSFRDFVSEIIAWTEANDYDRFAEFTGIIKVSRSNISSLSQKEIKFSRIRDKVSVRRIKKEIRYEKEYLSSAIETYKQEQRRYVNERKRKLIKHPSDQLLGYLEHKLKLKFPNNRKFAIKVSKENLDRLQDEWKSLILLRHPNIITVYTGGKNYYVMEFFSDKIEKEQIFEKFTIEEKIKIIIEAAKGLKYAHENGIIHRDIKPDNIFVRRDKANGLIVKIGDFGLAKTDLGMTSTGTILGTPHFMSPEQVIDTSNCDERSDVYSLGASLFYYLTGKMVFSGVSDVMKLIDLIRNKKAPKPSSVEKNIPVDLDNILEVMLAKKPNARPQTMTEIIDLLKGYLSEEEIDILSTRNFSQLKRRRRDKRISVVKRSVSKTRRNVRKKEETTSAKYWFIAGSLVVILLIGIIIKLSNRKPEVREIIKVKETKSEPKIIIKEVKVPVVPIKKETKEEVKKEINEVKIKKSRYETDLRYWIDKINSLKEQKKWKQALELYKKYFKFHRTNRNRDYLRHIEWELNKKTELMLSISFLLRNTDKLMREKRYNKVLELLNEYELYHTKSDKYFWLQYQRAICYIESDRNEAMKYIVSLEDDYPDKVILNILKYDCTRDFKYFEKAYNLSPKHPKVKGWLDANPEWLKILK